MNIEQFEKIIEKSNYSALDVINRLEQQIEAKTQECEKFENLYKNATNENCQEVADIVIHRGWVDTVTKKHISTLLSEKQILLEGLDEIKKILWATANVDDAYKLATQTILRVTPIKKEGESERI